MTKDTHETAHEPGIRLRARATSVGCVYDAGFPVKLSTRACVGANWEKGAHLTHPTRPTG